MSERHETRRGLWDLVWERLERGVADAAAAARHPVLATASPEGWPEARTVVLRRAVPEGAVCEVYTDVQSAKVASLRECARAELHVWDAPALLQIRVAARAEVLSGPAVAERWAGVPEGARAAYGKRPPPGTEIAGALDYEITAGRESFAVLRLHAERVEALHLGEEHRRAVFLRGDGWTGRWLSP